MSNIDDIKNWMTEALPVVAHWNTGGFTPDWHVNKIKAGNRMIPTIKINLLTNMQTDASGVPISSPPAMTKENIDFINNNQLPICIRTDNLASMATDRTRPDVTLENIPNSPVVYNIVNGVLHDQKIADVFGPTSIWKTIGEEWGQCKYMTDIQNRHPNVPYFILAENNEMGYDVEGNYVDSTLDTNNKPLYTPFGTRVPKWKTDLEARSLRVRDFAKNNTPTDFLKTYYANQNKHYNTMFEGFNSKLSSWKGKMLKEAYKTARIFCNGCKIEYSNQYESQLNHYDGGGTSIYNTVGKYGIFTSPEIFALANCIPVFDKAQPLNPHAFREVFVSMGGTAILAGAKAGKHEVITPELYAGYLQWMLWSIKGVRTPTMLRYWINNSVLPTRKMISDVNGIADAKNLGREDVLSLTEENYYQSTLDAVNIICEHPIIRQFWQDGTPVITGQHPENAQRLGGAMKTPVVYPIPEDIDNRWRLLKCNLNTPYELFNEGKDQPHYSPNVMIKVWSNAVELDGAYLIHLWTPCKLDGKLTVELPNVGTLELDVPKFNSYTVWYKEQILTLDQFAAIKEAEKLVKVKISWSQASSPIYSINEQEVNIFDVNNTLIETIIVESNKNFIEFNATPNKEYWYNINTLWSNNNSNTYFDKQGFIVINGIVQKLYTSISNINIEKVENA